VEYIGPLGIILVIGGIYFLSSIKILAEYERAVIFVWAICCLSPRDRG